MCFANLICVESLPSDFYSLESRNFKSNLLLASFFDSVSLGKAAYVGACTWMWGDIRDYV